MFVIGIHNSCYKTKLREHKFFQVVFNHRRNGEWGMEEKQPLIIMVGGDSAVKAFNPGHTVHILIESTMNYFQVTITLYFRSACQ